MRGRNTCWDPWHERSLDRRDFRDDHGSGPEEMPHKKAGKKKGKARSDHKHIYESDGWEQHYATKAVNVNGVWKYYKDSTRPIYKSRTFFCLECGKQGKREYDWSSNNGV